VIVASGVAMLVGARPLFSYVSVKFSAAETAMD